MNEENTEKEANFNFDIPSRDSGLEIEEAKGGQAELVDYSVNILEHQGEEVKTQRPSTIPPNSKKVKNKVLVTGANGYLGSHIVDLLLKKDYRVKGTISSKEQKEKYEHLLNFPEKYQKNLELVEANLIKTGIWDALLEDCEYVIHCASPNPIKQPKKEIDVVFPAVEGTLGILDAATRTQVKKIVITSRAVAVYAGHIKKLYTEEDWADPEKIMGYERSKLYAERAAWQFVKENSSLKITVLNPGLLLGPTLGNHCNFASGDLMQKLMMRKLPVTLKVQFPVVDVRVAAVAHIKAMENPLTNNNRYIICNKESYKFEQLIKILANEFAEYGYIFPQKEISYYPLKFVSFFDREVRLVLPYLGKDIVLSNEKSLKDLNLKYREIDETLVDMAYNFIRKKFIVNLVPENRLKELDEVQGFKKIKTPIS